MKNTVGVVLAAGLGMRLRPSTEKCPKPLIPVGGVEPLFFALCKLDEMGIRRVVVNTHYLSEKITASIQNWKSLLPQLSIRTADEKPEILGTGGAILNIIQKNSDWFSANDAGLLLQNGDTLAQFDLSQLIQKKQSNTFAVSYLEDHLKKYNPLWVDENGLYAGIGKVPKVSTHKPAHFLGVHYLSSGAIQSLLNSDKFPVKSIDLFNGIYKPLETEGHVFSSVEFFSKAKINSEFWFDMTTQEFLLEAQRYVLDTLMSSGSWSRVLKRRFPQIQEFSPGVWIESGRTGQKSFDENYVFKSPVVFVEMPFKGKDLSFAKLTLGPHASVIHEKGSFRSGDPAQPTLEVVNSVVFSDSLERTDLKEHTISNQICVL
jgi:NDP-sugar pyrophosphorylase family protein